jgi:hypothetical protein
LYSGKLIQYPVKEQIEDILPILIIAGTIGVACYFLDLTLIHFFVPDLIRMMITGLTYLAFYYASGRLAKLQAINDFKHLILKR